MKRKRRKRTKQATKKDKLDQVFSRFIRLKYADDRGYSTCYTCGIDEHIKRLHCGHFVSRNHLAGRFNEANCRPQCISCNIFKSGMNKEYTLMLIDEVGREEVDKLMALSAEIKKISLAEYDEMINHYMTEYEKIQNELGLDIW